MWLNSFVESIDQLGRILGGPFLVVLFYWFRFHTLKGTRSYTTRPLFLFGVAVFIAPFLMIYLILPDKLSPLAAILLVMLVWLVPVAPAAWRSFCQSVAGIPSQALGLQVSLAESSFEIRAEDMPSIRRKLGRIGYHPDDFRAVQSTAIQSRFLKISAILLHLENWRSERPKFFDRNSEQYSDLLRNFDLLSFKAIRSLTNSAAVYGAIMEERKVEPDDWNALESLATRDSPANQLQLAAQRAAGAVLEDLRKDMDFLLNSLLLFTARAALSGSWTFSGCKRRLEAVGFGSIASPPDITRTVAVAVCVTVAWSLAWLVALSGNIEIPGDRTAGVMRTFMVTPMTFIASFWLVHHLRRYYAFANQGMFGEAPTAFIASAGFLVAALIFPLQAYFDLIQFQGRGFIHVVLGDLPLLFFPLCVGSMTALLSQDSMWSSFRSVPFRRVMDGIVFGAGMVLAVSGMWISHKLFHVPVMEALDKSSNTVIVVGVFITTFAFGFVIGYLVVAQLRESAPRYVGNKPMMPGAILMGT